jgi:hypothetical protein
MQDEILHPGEFTKRLSEDHGSDIIQLGTKLGESDQVKGTYWSAYQLDDEYYITLNDRADYVWIANKSTVDLYIDK